MWGFFVEYSVAKLYKYCSSGDEYINSLRNDQIYLSDPSAFNDVFDCNLTINRISNGENLLKKIVCEILREKPNYYERFSEKTQQAIKSWSGFDGRLSADVGRRDNIPFCVEDMIRDSKKCGVCCFSEGFDCHLMWAHYAEKHQGFCIEYDYSIIDNPFIVPVSYMSELPRITVDEFLLLPNETLQKLWAVKNYGWAYEKEHRLIYPNMEGERLKKISDGISSDLKVTSVIVGYRISEKLKEELRKLCLERAWEFREMKIDSRSGVFEAE